MNMKDRRSLHEVLEVKELRVRNEQDIAELTELLAGPWNFLCCPFPEKRPEGPDLFCVLGRWPDQTHSSGSSEACDGRSGNSEVSISGCSGSAGPSHPSA